MAPRKQFKNVDEYIKTFPKDIQTILEEMRQTIREAAPEAEETISYQMPVFKQKGVLVWYAAFKDHIGFFPTALGVEAFKDELSGYAISKGTIQFPLDKPIPIDLMKRIVKFRLKQNLEK
jgi:uncharacterized protein YdhG (YjbR/CyaY superfamily)